jgi:outer membrane immunogenic protein
MNMRKLFRSVVLILCGLAGMMALASRAGAQEDRSPLEVGVDYNYVRANGPPGGCSCFSMNGGNIWAAYNFSHSFSAVGEFSGQHAGNINATGEDLTLYSYLFGPRYTLRKSDRWLPFGQVLLGGAHASGTYEPSLSGGSGSYNSFSLVVGGGLDVDVTQHIGIRAIETDYYLTRFPNGVNGRQNNLRISAGLVFRF